MAVVREKVASNIYRRRARGEWVYELSFRDSDGRQRRQAVGPRLAQAKTELAKVQAAMGSGQRVAPQRSLTFAVAAQRWYESTVALRPNTRSAYERSLRCHLTPQFGRRRLESITVDDVAVFAAKMATLPYRQAREPKAKRGLRAGTIEHVLITLSRVFEHARRRQAFAGSNPVRSLESSERPRDDEPKSRTVLSPEQVESLIAKADDGYRALIALLAHTGARLGEGLGVVWGDVDLGSRTVRFSHQLSRQGERVGLKTAHSRREIELPGALVAILAQHKLAAADSGDGALVFVSALGGHLDHRNVSRRGLARACKAAKLPLISPHALRHSHASALIAQGWDLVSVSRRLGHSSPTVTASFYAHEIATAERRAERLDALDGLYGAGTTGGLRVVG